MPDWLAHLPLAFLLIFGLLFILCGLLLLVMGWKTLSLRFGQSGWLQVPAEILSGTIEPRTLDESRTYLPKIHYRFAFAGQLRTASRLRLVERMYATERGALRKLAQYPVGTTVMVSFPADQPEEAVLEHGGGIAGLVLLVLGLGMVGGPLLLGAAAGYPVKPLALAIALLLALLWAASIHSRRRQSRARRDGLLPPTGCGSDADVERLLINGEKLLAIRLYRELHGTDLKTAREAIEALAGQ